MPELGGETSLETCLSEARQAGFTGIESGGKFPKTSKELIPILNKFDISLCSGWYGANLLKRSVKDEMENIRNQLNLFKNNTFIENGYIFESEILLKSNFKTSDLEKEMIIRTLEYFNNNRRAAAKSLGMSERTLYRKINDYGIEKKINKDS